MNVDTYHGLTVTKSGSDEVKIPGYDTRFNYAHAYKEKLVGKYKRQYAIGTIEGIIFNKDKKEKFEGTTA